MSTTQVLGDAPFAPAEHPHSSLTRRIDALPASVGLWSFITLLALGGFFELYDLFQTGYISTGRADVMDAGPDDAIRPERLALGDYLWRTVFADHLGHPQKIAGVGPLAGGERSPCGCARGDVSDGAALWRHAFAAAYPGHPGSAAQKWNL